MSTSHEVCPTGAVRIPAPAQRLADWMTENNWSIGELADVLGVNPAKTAGVLDGVRDMTPDCAERLEALSGIPAADWLNPSPDPDARPPVPRSVLSPDAIMAEMTRLAHQPAAVMTGTISDLAARFHAREERGGEVA